MDYQTQWQFFAATIVLMGIFLAADYVGEAKHERRGLFRKHRAGFGTMKSNDRRVRERARREQATIALPEAPPFERELPEQRPAARAPRRHGWPRQIARTDADWPRHPTRHR